MMSADVLRFGEFKTKSGRLSPYFVNTGNYKTGLQNSRLGEFYAALVKETIGDDFLASGNIHKCYLIRNKVKVSLNKDRKPRR